MNFTCSHLHPLSTNRPHIASPENKYLLVYSLIALSPAFLHEKQYYVLNPNVSDSNLNIGVYGLLLWILWKVLRKRKRIP